MRHCLPLALLGALLLVPAPGCGCSAGAVRPERRWSAPTIEDVDGDDVADRVIGLATVTRSSCAAGAAGSRRWSGARRRAH
jgi:hypothetical protein